MTLECQHMGAIPKPRGYVLTLCGLGHTLCRACVLEATRLTAMLRADAERHDQERERCCQNAPSTP